MSPQASAASGDDELIAEVDVFLSQPPTHRELYILEYPSRSATGPAVGRDRAVEGVRVRREYKRVEVKLSVYPRDDVTGSSDLSFEVGNDRPYGNERHSEDSQRFLSSPAAPPTANFTSAMYVPPEGLHEGNGSLVLVPLQKITTMRPSFAYLDEVDAELQRQKALAKAEREKEKGTLDSAAVADEGGDAGSGDEVRVDITFTKRETERAAERRQRSYAHLAKLESEDPWVELDFVDHTNPQIPASRKALFSTIATEGLPSDPPNGTQPVVDTVVKAEDGVAGTSASAAGANKAGGKVHGLEDDAAASYIDRLYMHAPGVNPLSEPSRQVGVLGGHFDSLRALKAERPEGAVAKLLSSARVARFALLRECVEASVDDDTLLEIIRRCAFLIRGCWVNSAPKTKSRKFSGSRTPPRLPASRTLILDMFRRKQVVRVADIFETTFAGVVPPDEDFVKEVLSEVAVYERGLGFIFRGPKDTAFVENFAGIALDEEDRWETRVKEARDIMVTGGRGAARGNASGRAGGRGGARGKSSRR